MKYLRTRRLFSATAALTTALVIAGTAGPAQAASSKITDGYGDVAILDYTDPVAGTTTDAKSIDVNWSTVTYEDWITFTYSVSDLKKDDAVFASGVVDISGNRFEVGAYYFAGQTDGLFLTYRKAKTTELVSITDKCKKGLSAKFDPSKNVIKLQLKRSCLDKKPGHIRAGGTTFGFGVEGEMYGDDITVKTQPGASIDAKTPTKVHFGKAK